MKNINSAKVEARSELGLFHWDRNNYKSLFNSLTDFHVDDNFVRVNYKTCSEHEFTMKYQEPCIPAVIIGAMDLWPALTSWNPSALKRKYHNEKFKVGEDDEGDNVHLSLHDFFEYSLDPALSDDSPLYIFDSNFGDRKLNNTASRITRKRKQDSDEYTNSALHSFPNESCPTSKLLDDYSIPKYFTDDFFQLTGESRRPPYRWIVIGPTRSGSGIHQDPLGTSAWNALVSGYKRWVLFPPSCLKSVVDPRGMGDHEAVTWFAKVYPRFRKVLDNGQTFGGSLGMLEILQKPQEVVFVPSGWFFYLIKVACCFKYRTNSRSDSKFCF